MLPCGPRTETSRRTTAGSCSTVVAPPTRSPRWCGRPSLPTSSLRSVWTGLVGQERAIEALERAAARPGHAYLLVGPAGSGVEVAARSFAADLVAPDGDERVRGLVLRGL